MLFFRIAFNNILCWNGKKIIAMGAIPVVFMNHDEDGIKEGQQDPEDSQVRFHTGTPLSS